MIAFLKGLSSETQVALLVGLGSQAFSIVVVIIAHLLSVRQDRKREEAESIKQKREFYRDRLEELFSLVNKRSLHNSSILDTIHESIMNDDFKISSKYIDKVLEKKELLQSERIELIIELYFPNLKTQKEKFEDSIESIKAFLINAIKRNNEFGPTETKTFKKLCREMTKECNQIAEDILKIDVYQIIK